MRNILLLTKNYILCAIGSIRGKKSRIKSSIGIILVLAIYLAFFGYMLFYQIGLVKELSEIGFEKTVLFLGYTLGIFMAVVIALQKVTGGQKSNDAELLLSMPLKKNEIMIAKALSQYLFNLAIVALFILPSIIAYTLFTPFVAISLLGNIITMLMVSFFVVGISYIMDFLTAFCIPNFKYGNIVKTIFVLIALVGFVFLYEYIVFNANTTNFGGIAIDYIVNFNPIFILSIIVISLAIFFLGIWLFSKTLNRENKTTKAEKIRLLQKRVTPFKALLKNEVSRYINSTVLMINTLLGPFGIIALTIWLAVDKAKVMHDLCFTFGVPDYLASVFIALAFGFLVIMTYSSAFSISLEGKQFWILRSMPIKTNTILLAKAIFNVLLITPITILCSIILLCVIKMQLIEFLTILFVPILLNIIVSFGGLFVNLLFPKFEFESEASVVKRSLSSVIMSLGGMGFLVLIAVLYFYLLDTFLPFTMILLIPIISLAVLAIASIILTITVGKRIFNRL